MPAITRALGTDLDEKMVYAVDTTGRLVGIDLRSQRWRPYLQSAKQLVGTPDGMVLGLDSTQHVLRLSARALTTYRAPVERGPVQLFPAPRARVIAVSSNAKLAQVLDEDGENARLAIPSGPIATTWFGDLLAVTNDSGVTLASQDGGICGGKAAEKVHFLSLRGDPTVSAFSPSGHRLYVARHSNDLLVVDRFGCSTLHTIDLPGTAEALRVDRTGRWLLARPAKGDSVWVVDLVRNELAATIHTRWAADLPLVTGGRTLIQRDGQDVVALDLTGATPKERSRLAGAADDLFLAVPWSPRRERPEAVATADLPLAVDSTPKGQETEDGTPPPATATTPEAEAIPTAPTGTAAASVYVQVASSQNKDWAQAFAQQLKDGGFPAKVLDPKTPGDGFKVVIGPYATRDEADAVGKRLGRPYFLVSQGGAET